MGVIISEDITESDHRVLMAALKEIQTQFLEAAAARTDLSERVEALESQNDYLRQMLCGMTRMVEWMLECWPAETAS